jgi:hypothetical protein
LKNGTSSYRISRNLTLLNTLERSTGLIRLKRAMQVKRGRAGAG